jgi:hypothetical protein
MPAISRNASCPCGSGKKYKKCCLHTTRAEAQGGALLYTEVERERAKQALIAFSQCEQFQKRRSEALRFCLSGIDTLPAQYRDQISNTNLFQQTLLTYLCLDQQLSGDDKPLVIRFLERYREELSQGERCFLESASASSVQIYEIVRIEPERGIELRDMRTNEDLWIKEAAMKEDLHVFDVLAARLIESSDNRMSVDGAAYRFTQVQALVLLLFLVERENKYCESFEIDAKSFMKLFAAPLINQFWMTEIFLPVLMKNLKKNKEQEVYFPYPYCASFIVHDAAALQDTLSSQHAQVHEFYEVTPGLWEWYGMPRDVNESRLGELRLIDDRLIGDAVSREDAERLPKLLQLLVGDALTLHSIEGAKSNETNEGENENKASSSMLRGTYDENWLDKPNPLVENRMETPVG